MGRATELLMLGDPVDSERAAAIGLATAVVEDGSLTEEAKSLARRMASGPAFAYAATKKLLTAEQDMSLASAIEMEAVTQALLMTTEDHAEFHRAFTEKRDPEWRGR
jgi:enoyl-CoA hydratase/carnithine racemase